MPRLRKRTCKACGAGFYWIARFKRPHDYCKKCRKIARLDRSIKVQSLSYNLPNGKYIVMRCVHEGMIGNVIKKSVLANSAYDGFWPEGMMVFNIKTRRVYEIQGEEQKSQEVEHVPDPPEAVKRRIKSSFPK